MASLYISKLPYRADAGQLFEQIAHLPWAQLLDSCQSQHKRSRYDILAADPVYKLITRRHITKITDRRDNFIEMGNDPFDLLHKYTQLFDIQNSQLPFHGGAIGYFGYDLIPEDDNDNRPSLINMPDMAFGIYEWAVITDHQQQTTSFVSVNPSIKADDILREHSTPACENNTPLQVRHLTCETDEPHYQKAFERIQHYLREGDCYQVNLARSFHAQCSGSAWLSYKRLRQTNPVPFAAYLDLPFARVLSFSPERFIKVAGSAIETSPIKGTRARSQDQKKNTINFNALKNSSKDRAENLMIVDLLRNDLGKSCQPGSIKVPELFSIEEFPTVYHMVSTITGEKRRGVSSIDVIRHSFPGGSITGAPKKRAMQIIQELEKYKRQLYCGAIGYISFNGNIDTNIAIRTLITDADKLAFWAGGGIVADSQAISEFEETNDKARAFVDLLRF